MTAALRCRLSAATAPLPGRRVRRVRREQLRVILRARRRVEEDRLGLVHRLEGVASLGVRVPVGVDCDGELEVRLLDVRALRGARDDARTRCRG